MDALMQKVAEVAPTHYAFLTKNAGAIRQSAFRDEIVAEMDGIIKAAEDSLTKVGMEFGAFASGISDAAQAFGRQPLTRYIGSTVAAGVALSLAGDLYESARRGLTKSRHWSNMLEQDPQLAAQAKTDPSVKTVFNTLHRFNPEFSGDPSVAASYVKSMIEFPDIGIVNQLVKSRAEIRNSGGLRVPGGIQLKGPLDQDEQQLRMRGAEASMENQKAQAFKNRQEGQIAFKQRTSGEPDRGKHTSHTGHGQKKP